MINTDSNTPSRTSHVDETPAAELEAGRELDKLIAEKVFGREVNYVKNTVNVIFYAPDTTGIAANAVPYYSTRIADAWEVIELMRGVSLHKRPDDSWACWHWVKGLGHTKGTGDTAALAICRAALAEATEVS